MKQIGKYLIKIPVRWYSFCTLLQQCRCYVFI